MPVITAHTGCMNTMDNSMESLYEALKYGCEVTEVDVIVTSDNVPILNHDSEIIDENGHIYKLAETKFEIVKNMKQKKGMDGVVTLEQFLHEAKGKICVNLDIKSMASIIPTQELVKKLKKEAEVVLTGCEHEKIIFCKEQGVELRYMFNADKFLKDKVLSEDIDLGIERVLQAAIKYGCGGINLNYHLVSEKLIKKAHSVYMPVCAWTVNTEEEAKDLVKIGVDSITTRKPDIIRNALGRNA